MSRLFLAVLAAAVAVTSTACATGAGGRSLQPLPHQGDAPVAFTALGARYSVPPRLAITDHDRQPGLAWFEYTDQNTGCSGGLIFLTSSDSARASSYVSKTMQEDVAGFKQHGVESEVKPTTEPILGEKAAVQVASLTTPSDKAAKAHFGVFIAEQQLVVMGNLFCSDPGLMEPQLHFVAQVVNSQKQAN